MVVPRSLEETFRFFEEPHNLSRITPPWLNFQVKHGQLEMKNGLGIDYTIRWLGLPMKWRSRITQYNPPYRFVDQQERGPYRYWHHLHEFKSVPGGTLVTDEVTYALPLGFLGRMAHALVVRRQLEGIFRFRQKALTEILGSAETEKQLAENRA